VDTPDESFAGEKKATVADRVSQRQFRRRDAIDKC